MKTRRDIEQLKAAWQRDPLWDLEGTEGFEAHEDELRQFRLTVEERWRAAADERERRIDAEAERIGVHGLLRLLREADAAAAAAARGDRAAGRGTPAGRLADAHRARRGMRAGEQVGDGGEERCGRGCRGAVRPGQGAGPRHARRAKRPACAWLRSRAAKRARPCPGQPAAARAERSPVMGTRGGDPR